ncbi:26S proteasome, regulatory subunit Rpn7 [Ophiocordyceps sinensis CO18]|uniref:26S proteasome, regulatory subunit Rpn7 n=1 Tax=Ophiocordyceps sinensis (strain Co18 / CGMCC 3.14243) TaxID=911162 RepID=T5AJ91_OPHSC|nr:26S proteasome, regulatory subunit Rpn7 [Ophiocordyceps sinensis CO18]
MSTCPPLCVDALKAAILEAKQGPDVTRYMEAWDCIRLAAPGEPEAQRDQAWIDRIEAENKAELSRLEAELKGYKNNLIKESIRMGHEDLGKHLENTGKLQEALEAYGRMRQDVSTTKHIIDCGKHLANVSLQRHDWSTALSAMSKTAGVHGGDFGESPHAFIKIVSGISHLGMGHYDDAAQFFLQADFAEPPSKYAHIASPNDVAIYGGLTALATMERQDLQQRVLDNHAFRMFLEHEPHLRKAISLFINGRYTSCLSILESARPDYLLDYRIHKHIPAIYSKIRTKCIVQYCEPFSRVTIASLDAAFGQPGQSMKPELVEMIRDGLLKARIDAKNGLLVAARPDPRVEMQNEVLDVTHKYEQEAKERLRRINLVAAGLEHVGNKKQTTDESWWDYVKNLGQEGGAPGES